MQVFFIIFFSGFFSSLAGLSYKIWHKYNYRPDSFLFIYSIFFTAFCLILAFVYGEPLYSPAAALLGTFSGIISFSVIRLFYSVTFKIKLSISWTIIQFSILVPFFLSILIYKERMENHSLIGTGLILLSIILFGIGKGGTSKPSAAGIAAWIPVLSCLILNGTFLTIPRIYAAIDPSGGTFSLLFYNGIMVMMISSAYLFLNIHKSSAVRFPRGIFKLSIFMGMVNTLGPALLIIAVKLSPGTVVYPLRTVTNLLFVFLLSYLLFREKMNLPEAAGAGSALIGLVLVSLSLG